MRYLIRYFTLNITLNFILITLLIPLSIAQTNPLNYSKSQYLFSHQTQELISLESHCLCYRDLLISINTYDDSLEEQKDMNEIQWVTSCRKNLKSCKQLQARIMSVSLFSIPPLWFEDIDEILVTPCVSFYGAPQPYLWFDQNIEWSHIKDQQAWYTRGKCLMKQVALVEMIRHHEEGRKWFDTQQKLIEELILKLNNLFDVFMMSGLE